MTCEIIIKIEIVENKKNVKREESYSIAISQEDAKNLDKCEKALMEANSKASRRFLNSHFSQVSKEKALEYGKESEIFPNKTEYRVESEAGRYSFTTHHVKKQRKKIYNTAQEFFPAIYGKERYKTQGFRELMFIHGVTKNSYRKTSELLNRIRYQQQGDGTPYRSLQEYTETEGQKIIQATEKKCMSILQEKEFNLDNLPSGPKIKPNQIPIESSLLDNTKVEEALIECEKEIGDYYDLVENPIPYEDPEYTVNITSDDVCVKKQKMSRSFDLKADMQKYKRVYNSIIHVEKGANSYILNSHSITKVIKVLIAFLSHNNLFHFRLQFFTDGMPSLHESILKHFQWYKNICIILDWYHLEKKCKQRLSGALKNRHLRNNILEELKRFLWYGLMDDAIDLLRDIAPIYIKDNEHLEKLIAYLTRNSRYIPCYAARKKLGLRNGSSIGEKANDIIVSERQKHNGMSWSNHGSVSLALITATIWNNEHEKWFQDGDFDFLLSAA